MNETAGHPYGPAPEERRGGLAAAILIVAILVIVAGMLAAAGWAGLSLYRESGGPGTGGAGDPRSIPESFTGQLANAYTGYEVEKVYWAPGASTGTTPSVVAWLRSTETTGFRHIATLDVARGPQGLSDGTLSAPWEYFFTEGGGVASMGSRAMFEGMWVRDHPGLACGAVFYDDRELPYPLSGFQAEAYSVGATGELQEAGVFWYRFNSMTEQWDTVSDPEARPPMAVSDAEARKVATRALPAFRVVRVVPYPAIVGAQVGDRFVVLRHPGTPGFLLVRDPLWETPEDPLPFMDLVFDGPFLGKIDTRARAFMRDWTKAHPGTVVAGFGTFSYTGSSPDYLMITYYPSLDSVATATTLLEDEFRYDAKAKRWSSAK